MADFIGKTISLISLADIRYRGVLHSIDKDAATVSLEKGELSAPLLPVTTHSLQSARSAPRDAKAIRPRSCPAMTMSTSASVLHLYAVRADRGQVHRLSSQ
jgi:hypothetical protein